MPLFHTEEYTAISNQSIEESVPWTRDACPTPLIFENGNCSATNMSIENAKYVCDQMKGCVGFHHQSNGDIYFKHQLSGQSYAPNETSYVKERHLRWWLIILFVLIGLLAVLVVIYFGFVRSQKQILIAKSQPSSLQV